LQDLLGLEISDISLNNSCVSQAAAAAEPGAEAAMAQRNAAVLVYVGAKPRLKSHRLQPTIETPAAAEE
jgi:hypothetical protein